MVGTFRRALAAAAGAAGGLVGVAALAAATGADTLSRALPQWCTRQAHLQTGGLTKKLPPAPVPDSAAPTAHKWPTPPSLAQRNHIDGFSKQGCARGPSPVHHSRQRRVACLAAASGGRPAVRQPAGRKRPSGVPGRVAGCCLASCRPAHAASAAGASARPASLLPHAPFGQCSPQAAACRSGVPCAQPCVMRRHPHEASADAARGARIQVRRQLVAGRDACVQADQGSQAEACSQARS